jgi:hypothetical protein
MQRTLISHACLVVVLCLVAGAALAGECKPINVRIGPSTYLDPCTYDGTDYLYCIDAPIRGTLNGIWHYYGEGGQVEAYPDSPYSSLWAGWAIDVIETNRGTIYAQDNWLWNLSVGDLEGIKAGWPMVTISVITDGTDQYEGASGWIGMILDDTGNWRGFMKGEICVP